MDAENPRLQPRDSLVIAARRNDAAMALERVPERGLVSDAFGLRIESREQLPHGLLPPVWNESLPHRLELGGAAIYGLHDFDGVGWATLQ
jgi:hypothetical protein